MKNYSEEDPLAIEIDKELFSIEREINWLDMVSPTRNDERWERFKNSDFQDLLELTYPTINIDYDRIRKKIHSLPVSKIKHPLVSFLLHEKAEELDLFLDLLEKRNTRGFLATSISLFGGTRPTLVEKAKKILSTVPRSNFGTEIAGASDLAVAAENMKAMLQTQHPKFDFNICIEDDLNSHLMVNHGNLYIARSIQVPKARVDALVAHEVGVHLITRFNGLQQPLKQLGSGLAFYDCLQEGLAVFSEYLAGCLPGERLRVLAARVIASQLAVQEKSLEDIFWCLKLDYEIDPEDSFDIAVRAKRGGGLTKDAVYLEGLDELLSYLRGGEALAHFFIGKFAMEQRELIDHLVEEGILLRPTLLPPEVHSAERSPYLAKARNSALKELYTEDLL